MPYGWTAEQLRAAIERCEAETEDMARQGASEEDLKYRRQGLAKMRAWLERVEGENREAQD